MSTLPSISEETNGANPGTWPSRLSEQLLCSRIATIAACLFKMVYAKNGVRARVKIIAFGI
jgi:hypothetical protein